MTDAATPPQRGKQGEFNSNNSTDSLGVGPFSAVEVGGETQNGRPSVADLRAAKKRMDPDEVGNESSDQDDEQNQTGSHDGMQVQTAQINPTPQYPAQHYTQN